MKTEGGKRQDVMTLSDSDDVQTISSGSDDNKEREKRTQGEDGGGRERYEGEREIGGRDTE